jgi:hypothetical protein
VTALSSNTSTIKEKKKRITWLTENKLGEDTQNQCNSVNRVLIKIKILIKILTKLKMCWITNKYNKIELFKGTDVSKRKKV